MRVVAYLRVSTATQAEDGLGLDVQEADVRKWARANGHRIIAVTRDEGVSGSNGLDSRVGLLDAIDLLRSRKAQGLVVYRLDRLARDLIVQETVLRELRLLGAEVFSTSPTEAGYLTDDPDDPTRALVRQLLGAVAQYERAMITLRLRSGRLRKAQNGGYAHGSPPFGYRADAGELVPDEREQEPLERIRDLRRSGASLRAIADTLTTEGFRPRRGVRWHPESLRLIVNRLEETPLAKSSLRA